MQFTNVRFFAFQPRYSPEINESYTVTFSLFQKESFESLQGMCYIDNLTMKNCKLLNTTLAFEYSTVDADISSKIDSVLNPSGGVIRAERIDELIIEKDKVDPQKTKIIIK